MSCVPYLLALFICFLRHFSLIATTFQNETRKLLSFSYSYSAAGGTRTRRSRPIEYEYEYRFTEYEYDFEEFDGGDQREESFLLVHQRIQPG